MKDELQQTLDRVVVWDLCGFCGDKNSLGLGGFAFRNAASKSIGKSKPMDFLMNSQGQRGMEPGLIPMIGGSDYSPFADYHFFSMGNNHEL
jgi:hypothetical protein